MHDSSCHGQCMSSTVLPNPRCLICGWTSSREFAVCLLGDTARYLYRCQHCKSYFFPNPDWLERAYASVIHAKDTGVLQRAIDIGNVLTALLVGVDATSKKFLDFGGGWGVLARLMRDRGFDFSNCDPLCPSLFPLPTGSSEDASFVTLVEVLEHLPDPLGTLLPVSASWETLFISTHLAPPTGITPEWWYLLPETGQHVLFPTLHGLEIIAERMNMHLISNGRNLHLMTRGPATRRAHFMIRNQKFAWTVGAICAPFLRRRALDAIKP